MGAAVSKDLAKYSFGVRDLQAYDHWCEAPADFSLLNNYKTIVIFPGSGSTEAKNANGMCKIFENMLPEGEALEQLVLLSQIPRRDVLRLAMALSTSHRWVSPTSATETAFTATSRTNHSIIVRPVRADSATISPSTCSRVLMRPPQRRRTGPPAR